MIYNPVPFKRGPIWWTLLYNAGETKVEHESVTPYLALAGEPWGVCFVRMWDNFERALTATDCMWVCWIEDWAIVWTDVQDNQIFHGVFSKQWVN